MRTAGGLLPKRAPEVHAAATPADAAGRIPPRTPEEAYTDLVNSNRPWSWADDFPDGQGLTVAQRRQIRADAVRRGLIPEVPFKPGTRFPDFESAGLLQRVDSLPQEVAPE